LLGIFLIAEVFSSVFFLVYTDGTGGMAITYNPEKANPILITAKKIIKDLNEKAFIACFMEQALIRLNVGTISLYFPEFNICHL
jgi:hypothetical protein